MSSILKYFTSIASRHFGNGISPACHPSVSRFTTDISSIVNCVPKEMLQKICSYLENVSDVIHFGLANRHLRCLLSEEGLWDLFLQKDFPDSYTNFKSDIKNLALYKQRTIVSHNIKAGKCALQTFDKQHGQVNCLTVYDNKLISGSQYNGAIEILDLETGKELKWSQSHQGPVSCLTVYGDRLISGSEDNTIKIWDLKTGKELMTLNGHQWPVKCITVYGNKLISGSIDNTIKIWELETGKELMTLNGHQGPVNCITVYGDGKLISGSIDNTIKIWNLKTGHELKTLNGHQGSVKCITVYDNKLISGSMDDTIKIWDLKTGQELKTLNGHQGSVKCMAVYDHKLISGAEDNTIKIWDLKTGQELKTLKTGATCLTVYDGKLISGSWDYMIRDFNFLSLSPYSKQVLEKNLKILESMARAEYAKHPEVVEKLAENLHLYFKQRLRQLSCKMGIYFSYSTDLILHVQTEVCVEMLLNAIHDKDDHKVSQLLDQLICINVQNTKIYELLWEISGSPDFYKWGELAFHNQHECSASYYQKEQAVIAFKQILYQIS